jgi:hypothetical protein
MDPEAVQMCNTWEKLLETNDGETAWNMQGEFARVWNKQKPYSKEREAMAAIWEKAMIKWH